MLKYKTSALTEYAKGFLVGNPKQSFIGKVISIKQVLMPILIYHMMYNNFTLAASTKLQRLWLWGFSLGSQCWRQPQNSPHLLEKNVATREARRAGDQKSQSTQHYTTLLARWASKLLVQRAQNGSAGSRQISLSSLGLIRDLSEWIIAASTTNLSSVNPKLQDAANIRWAYGRAAKSWGRFFVSHSKVTGFQITGSTRIFCPPFRTTSHFLQGIKKGWSTRSPDWDL